MRAWRIAGLVALAVVALLALMDASDVLSYVLNPEAYHFGTEVGGFRYDSSERFLGVSVATIVIAMLAFLAPRIARTEMGVARTRVCAALAAVLLSIATAW